ncbi:MAG: glutathione peroxidase [Flammeovirgaceae bacterium]|nr:glutathione peroxidase [Flammeovirgaceae bacterium]|tara:strand:- start:6302 stop:6829 length:528 start_codon:yes stop_codon:yes gene_type:complete
MIAAKIASTKTAPKFYELKAQNAAGDEILFDQFKGKTVLIINTATRCGLSSQFKQLEKLHNTYQAKGLTILGFPCNQFMSQEPETNETMEASCLFKFGVTFQMMSKIKVNGPNAHPVFKYLKNELSELFGSRIKWNFTKFLITNEGMPFRRYGPYTQPNALERDIKKLVLRKKKS